MDADDERQEELSTIAAIFPELQLNPEDPFAASLELSVELTSPVRVTFSSSASTHPLPPSLPPPPTSNDALPHDPVAATPPETHTLKHLPPVKLQVKLPDGYPASKPLEVHLSTSPAWLPQARLQDLEKEAENLWDEYGRSQVVYAYIDFIQQAAERGFDICCAVDATLEFPEHMKVALLAFDKTAQREKFEQGTYDCGVCLEPKKGLVCHRISRCGHVFCVACLKDFYTSAITEGDVSTVRCLDPTCGDGANGAGRRKKPQPTLGPNELLQIPLDYATVKRYVELKRKKRIESDKATIYCPRKWCQGPARSKKFPKLYSLDEYESFFSSDDDEPEEVDTQEPKVPNPMADRLAVCEDCDFAFCRVCLAGWHGDLIRCYPRSSKELTEEEQASYNYIRLRTSACPTCNSPAQKTMGCNHMTCFTCKTHFCYLCTAWLSSDNPYAHFNDPKKPCFMRLWELEAGDEGEHVRYNGVFEAGAIAPAPPQGADPIPMPEIEPPIVLMLNQLQVEDGPDIPADRAPADAPQAGRGRDRNRRRRQAAPRVPAHLGGEDAADLIAQRGLQRFLQMAANDEEDEWDSDELEGDDDEFAQFR